ncbi:MAG: PhzF family phenazine biosynthesis protein [Maricaulis sp.]|uniref:PhzF family phenazine biosynthesis protein n=1 Tax=Maricaulis sp. TaxID=1486257 RepID=UPI0026105590|nr:PhzF family phenazine biosynthesis protein [Maricaulis sp.]MDM7985395.1 PhzF family phenazine biosynthesis protein [Maricaulis sp.]
MPHRFETFDVFTDTPMAGNPLAVVYEADDLDTEAMQAIAAEFNLSETVFITEPRGRDADWGVRIFTPKEELPFAGHPTVGSAIALALKAGGEPGTRKRYVLEETVGDITADARINSPTHGSARFFLPRLPERVADIPSPDRLSEAFGIEPDCFLNTPLDMGVWSAGVPIGIVPVRYAEDLARIQLNMPAFEAVFGGDTPIQAYLVAKASSMEHTNDWRVRMFAPHLGILEDPATGGAAAAFMGLLAEQGGFGEGETALSVYQGIEMGRPSLLRLVLKLENGQLTDAMIGGDAVMISRGELL